MTINQLIEKFGGDHGYWGEHPNFPVQDWKNEVSNNDTKQGYWEWVQAGLFDG
jgi:hypothetical protein